MECMYSPAPRFYSTCSSVAFLCQAVLAEFPVQRESVTCLSHLWNGVTTRIKEIGTAGAEQHSISVLSHHGDYHGNHHGATVSSACGKSEVQGGVMASLVPSGPETLVSSCRCCHSQAAGPPPPIISVN